MERRGSHKEGARQSPGRNIGAKAGLNRGILRSGWGLLVRRLEDKAPGRVAAGQTRVDEPAVPGDIAAAAIATIIAGAR